MFFIGNGSQGVATSAQLIVWRRTLGAVHVMYSKKKPLGLIGHCPTSNSLHVVWVTSERLPSAESTVHASVTLRLG